MADPLTELTDQIQADNPGINRATAGSRAYRQLIADADRRHRAGMDERERQEEGRLNLADLRHQLAAEDAAEDRGMHADDRITCHTHQAWFADCLSNADGVHANPVTGFNWCRNHNRAVQQCGCRPATVNG